MILHENPLPADNFHEISYYTFFLKIMEDVRKLSSAAVVIFALRVRIQISTLRSLHEFRVQSAKWFQRKRCLKMLIDGQTDNRGILISSFQKWNIWVQQDSG